MKLVKKTAEFRIFKRRDGRFAVKDAKGQPINAEEKVKILLAEGLVTAPEPKPVEEPVEEPAAEEAPAEEAPAEEAPAEEAPAEEAPAEEAPAEEAAAESSDDAEEPKA